MDALFTAGITTLGVVLFVLPAVMLFGALTFKTRMSLSTLQQALHLDSAVLSIGLLFSIALFFHALALFMWTIFGGGWAFATAKTYSAYVRWEAAEDHFRSFPQAIGVRAQNYEFQNFVRLMSYCLVMVGEALVLALFVTWRANRSRASGLAIDRDFAKILYGPYADLLCGKDGAFIVIAAVQTIAPSAREVSDSPSKPIMYYGVVEDLSIGRGDETRRIVLRRPLKLLIDQSQLDEDTSIVSQRPVVAGELNPLLVIEGREIANIAFHRVDLAPDAR